MKTFMASPSTIERKWYVVDATGYTLGRLASEIAKVLRGKNKPIYTPHADAGDYVIVVNAEKIAVTGKKLGDLGDVTKLAGFEFTNHVEYSDTGEIIALRGLNVKNGKLILDDVKYIDKESYEFLSKTYKRTASSKWL